MTQTPNHLAETQEWNPDRACEEMADLFLQADAIFQQQHYQEEASVDGLDNSNADSLLTDQTERQEINQSWQN